MHSNCKHEFQLETVGGVYLTGAYVCTRCSHRVSMSHEQFHQHARYPRHYQDQAASEASRLDSDVEETSTLRDDRHGSHRSA